MDEAANIPSNDSKAQDDNVPLLFNIPIGMSSRYAHHLLVQAGENEVTLSFFELFPPLVFDEAKQLIEVRKGVRADCVARITIAKGRYPEFVKALVGALGQPEVEK